MATAFLYFSRTRSYPRAEVVLRWLISLATNWCNFHGTNVNVTSLHRASGQRAPTYCWTSCRIVDNMSWPEIRIAPFCFEPSANILTARLSHDNAPTHPCASLVSRRFRLLPGSPRFNEVASSRSGLQRPMNDVWDNVSLN